MGRKKGHPTVVKCLSIGMRVSVKDKYALDLLCRVHRLNLSSLINFMLEKEKAVSLTKFDHLWANNDQVRLIKLHKIHPDLLSADEKKQLED